MRNNIFILSLISTITFTSCSDNDENSETIDPNASLYSAVLTDVSLDVITATYNQLYTNAGTLKTAVENLTVVGQQHVLLGKSQKVFYMVL